MAGQTAMRQGPKDDEHVRGEPGAKAMVPGSLHRLSRSLSSSNLIVERGSLSTSDALNGFTSEPCHASMDRAGMAPASQPGDPGAGDVRIKRLKALEGSNRPLSSSKSLQYLRVMEKGGLSMHEFANQMKADARTQVSPRCWTKDHMQLVAFGVSNGRQLAYAQNRGGLLH
jgi:hypothetical protein